MSQSVTVYVFAFLCGAATIGTIWCASSGDWSGAVASALFGFGAGLLALAFLEWEDDA